MSSDLRPQTEVEAELSPVIVGDMLHYIHGSEVVIICLSPAHKIVQNNLKVKEVKFSKTHIQSNKNHRVVKNEKVCEIITEDGATHLVRYDRDGLLLEANLRLLKNPGLINNSPTYEGYLAIVRYSSNDKNEYTFKEIV